MTALVKGGGSFPPRGKKYSQLRYNIRPFQNAGVLILLDHMDDEYQVLLCVRSENLRTHPGEVCFPGGMFDDVDKDLQQTAIREAEEVRPARQRSRTEQTPAELYLKWPWNGCLSTLVSLKIDTSYRNHITRFRRSASRPTTTLSSDVCPRSGRGSASSSNRP